jgi:hypothetical protein
MSTKKKYLVPPLNLEVPKRDSIIGELIISPLSNSDTIISPLSNSDTIISPLISPLSNPDHGPFINSIKLSSSLNYSKIKDFPIFWSGFFVDNIELNDFGNSFETKGEILIEKMKNASKIPRGYSSLDVIDYSNDEDNEENEENTESNIVTLVTGRDSLISIDESLISTERSSLSNPKKLKTFMTQRGTKKQRKQSNADIIIDPTYNFSKKFTKLALESNPENIGLFVNCTPAEFITKFFYKVEFDIIQQWCQRIKQKVKIYIFNLKNMNCFYIKPTVEILVARLKSKIPDTQLKQIMKDKIKPLIIKLEKNNCYEAKTFVISQIERLKHTPIGEYSKYSYKDPEKRKIFFTNIIINPIFEKLQNINCSSIKIKFQKQINDFLKSEFNTSIENIELTWKSLIDILNNLKTKLHNNNLNNCVEIYEILKDILTIVEHENPITAKEKNDFTAFFIQINKILDNENDKNCFYIQRLLEKKMKKKNNTQKNKKKYITFECFTCNSLTDCAKIINQQIKLSLVLKEKK